MRNFLERHATFVALIAISCAALSIILGILLLAATELHHETIKRFDRGFIAADLPGRKHQISVRSRLQFDTLLRETPHVVGGWVSKTEYAKTENPIIHAWDTDGSITKALEAYGTRQQSGLGFSSLEVANFSNSIRNSDEAKLGLIACLPLAATPLLKLSPELSRVGAGICRAVIPPFDDHANLALIVVIDNDGSINGPDIKTVRRALLQLQIDIFNRDYQGRETWAHF